jgi:zinc transport system substrate-binding protein
MKSITKWTLFVLFISFGLNLSAQSVVATNGWTASFAQLAGADDVLILAPSDMKHPPEYEISLKEMQIVAQADYLVFAGYEAMMGRIRESLGDESQLKMIQITTVNSQQIIHESVMKIAEVLGTQSVAAENLKNLDDFFDLWRKDLSWHQEMLSSVIVHFHQNGPAGSLGIKPLMVFGPAPPTLGENAEVLKIKPALIIDNYHNPVADPFLEMDEEPAIVRWINFPGTEGTTTLMDVLEYNRKQLNQVLD